MAMFTKQEEETGKKNSLDPKFVFIIFYFCVCVFCDTIPFYAEKTNVIMLWSKLKELVYPCQHAVKWL